MFILPWVHEKFTVTFTMSNVDGCAIYMHIGHLNCPEYVYPLVYTHLDGHLSLFLLYA